jgi:hypothetical protein
MTTVFQIEFYRDGEPNDESFAYIMAYHVPRIGDVISLYQNKHQGHDRYKVEIVELHYDLVGAEERKNCWHEHVQVAIKVRSLQEDEEKIY